MEYLFIRDHLLTCRKVVEFLGCQSDPQEHWLHSCHSERGSTATLDPKTGIQHPNGSTHFHLHTGNDFQNSPNHECSKLDCLLAYWVHQTTRDKNLTQFSITTWPPCTRGSKSTAKQFDHIHKQNQNASLPTVQSKVPLTPTCLQWLLGLKIQTSRSTLAPAGSRQQARSTLVHLDHLSIRQRSGPSPKASSLNTAVSEPLYLCHDVNHRFCRINICPLVRHKVAQPWGHSAYTTQKHYSANFPKDQQLPLQISHYVGSTSASTDFPKDQHLPTPANTLVKHKNTSNHKQNLGNRQCLARH